MLLRAAGALGLVAAALTLADTMTSVLAGSAARAGLEQDYARRTGSSAELAQSVLGASLAGAFVTGIAYAAAIAVLALLAARAGRGARTGLVICALLALPGAFGSAWSLGGAVALACALACVLARPAAAAFRERQDAADRAALPQR